MPTLADVNCAKHWGNLSNSIYRGLGEKEEYCLSAAMITRERKREEDAVLYEKHVETTFF